MKKGKSLLILITSLVYIVLIIYGIKKVYTAPISPVKEKIITQPQNNLVIAKTDVFGTLERPQVIFNHQKHVEAIKKEGKKEWETCSICHRIEKSKIIKEGKIIETEGFTFEFPKKKVKLEKEALKKAYHDECIGCHKERLKEKKKSGPITCGDCHIKEYELVKIKYPVVEFDPKLHYDHETKLKERIGKKDCSICHHTYDLKEKKLIYKKETEESCYFCHDFNTKKLTDAQKKAFEKGLDKQKAFHKLCINCHITELSKLKKAGPVECIKCHTGKYRSIEELKNIPRPDRKQPKVVFITQDNATTREVYFDHSFHEREHKTCRECHHYSLKSCKECHSITGKEEGNWINSAQAMHNVFSKRSCIGCHYHYVNSKKECSGCHFLMKPVDIATLNPKSELCNKCHTGKQKPSISQISKLSAGQIKDNIKIEILKREYEPAEMPHLVIVNKLIENSNKSKLAAYFHRNEKTICLGCHHNTQKTEIDRKKAPLCRSCHPIISQKPEEVKLISAYHIGCLGCHKKMELKKGIKCVECHKEPPIKFKEIVTEKNWKTIEKNKKDILQVWHPE